MIICMKRTTLVLEDACMDRIRDLARRENRQLSELVNEILVQGLEMRKKAKSKPFHLPTFHMGKPRFNLADRDILESLMEK